MMKNLPDPALIANITFPSADQYAKAKEVLAEHWGPMVSGK